jgi:hypothetical protein
MKLILIVFLFITQCNFGIRDVVLPKLSNIDSIYCSTDGGVIEAGKYISSIIGKSTWEDVQTKLIEENSELSNQKSIRLQEARSIIAACAVLLFQAVPTGSARDLADINTKNALKDIDMSVPIDKTEDANQWLSTIVKNPDKTMSLALLMNPLDTIPCRAFKGKDLTECGKINTLETTQLLLLREYQNAGKVKGEFHFAQKDKIDAVCPTGFVLPKEDHRIFKILALKKKKDLENFVTELPEKMNSENNFTSKNRIYFFYIALNNPAYYLQSESLRRWVVQREDEFQKEMLNKYPDYASGKGIIEIERDGAVLEQYISAVRYDDSLYYKNKYMFRAMDHIGFDIEKKIPEFAAIHRILKKTRPDSIDESFIALQNSMKSDEFNKEVALKKYSKSLPKEEFVKIIKEADKVQFDALVKYFEDRKKDQNSIWRAVCKL